MAPASRPRPALPTATGWGAALGSELCTTVVDPSNAPLDAATTMVTIAATMPAANPASAASEADRDMRRRLDDRLSIRLSRQAEGKPRVPPCGHQLQAAVHPLGQLAGDRESKAASRGAGCFAAVEALEP